MDQEAHKIHVAQVRDLLEQRRRAHEDLEKAQQVAAKVDAQLARWFAERLKGIYAQWMPNVGDQAVRILFSGVRPSSELVRVLEARGRRIRLGDREVSGWGLGLDLDQLLRGESDDNGGAILELIVPREAFNEEVHLWLGLPKV